MYSICKVRGDGNCLYRAIAHQINELFYLTFDHKAVRQDLARYVEENQEEPGMKAAICSNFPENEQPYRASQYSKHIANQYKDGTWGGTDILIAAANFYLVSVVVHRPNETSIIIKPQIPEDVVGNINLYYSNDHYDSLILANNAATNKDPNNSPHESSLSRTILDTCSSTLQSSTSTDYAADNTGYRIIGTKAHCKQSYDLKTIRIATWNVRGAADAKKKCNIDLQLKENQVDIACLQETHMKTGTLDTKNYNWHLFGNNKHRGLAILIRKNTNLLIKDIQGNTNTMAAVISSIQGRIYIITTHVPHQSSQASYTFSDLLYLIKKKPNNSVMILLGDFNAHIGQRDVQDLQTAGRVGKTLQHKYSNKNGDILIDIMKRENLCLETSFGRNSCLKTWKSGNNTSQIDHVLTAAKPKFNVKDLKGVTLRKISDHKLIIGKIKELPDNSNKNAISSKLQSGTVKETTDSNQKFDYRHYDYEKLNQRIFRTKYQEEIRKSLTSELQETPIPWCSIMEAMKTAAKTTLLRTPKYSRERRYARAQLQKAQFLNKKYPNNPEYRSRIKECRGKLKEIIDGEEENEYQSFFEDLQKRRPGTRMRITYEFYRRHVRKERANKKRRYIPISQWESELSKQEGPHITLHNDENPNDLLDPPTEEDIADIITKMRRNTAPGMDGIVAELFKALPNDIMTQIVEHMRRAWIENVIPPTWNQTIQVPIPKRTKPQSINDYRRISICCTGYRIYASYLLTRLDLCTSNVGNYQAAFFPNRSTDDHIFTLRRVLDEKWREGTKCYVMAVDIEKAFDTVDLNALKDILTTRTNKTLTNRIIKACMNELTSIRWFGQQTKPIKKGKGVKQGCPLSPRLFTILIDDVLQTLEEEIPALNLNQDSEITLPMILSFADDLIIISTDISELNSMFTRLKHLLETVGLKTNDTKTKLLIRDPNHLQGSRQFIFLAGTNIVPVSEIRYLGTYITAGHNRRNTVRTRCKQGMKNSKTLISLIKKTKMQWKTARILYKMIIEPTMTYGLKAAAITKANRSMLRRYERMILSDMLNHTRDPPKNTKTHQILQGKTITKRVKFLRMCYYGHILRRTPPHILHTALKFKARRLKIGRPIFTWNDSISHDMNYYNKTRNEWRELAKDRKKLQTEAREIFDIAETDSEADICEDEEAGQPV